MKKDPILVIALKNFGHLALDPRQGNTWIEAERVRDLWQGRKKVPSMRSRTPDGKIDIWFVSLDWLVTVCPDKEWLQGARDCMRNAYRDGYQAGTSTPVAQLI